MRPLPFASTADRLLRPLRSFHPAAMPALARRNYRLELTTSFFMPFMLTGVETGVAAVTVKNAWEGVVEPGRLDVVVGIVGAAKAFANIASFIWVRLGHARDKVRFTLGLQWLMLVLILGVALMPRTEWGLWGFAIIVVLSRVVWAGYLTFRSTMWRANYARNIRGRVTGKFTTVQVVQIGILGIGFGAAMDASDQAFRVLIPLGCALSLLGMRSWSRLRVRGHKQLLAQEAAQVGFDRPSFNPATLWSVLARDPLYRRYMVAMFLLGTGNLMVPPLLAIIVRERFDMAYLEGILITGSIPMLVMPLAIPIWASYLDRTHVARFRIIHCWVFLASHASLLVALLTGQAAWLYIASVILGVAFGGGALAWNLGHLDFAPPERASQYMGVHVTLTGVRGLIAPFVGIAAYRALESAGHSGAWVFAGSVGLCLIAAWAFVATARAVGAEGVARAEPVETTPPSKTGV
ncbi:MAG: MFS transporter [Phycisphaerales bacterium JB037]